MGLGSDLLDWIYPPTCAHCNALNRANDVICSACHGIMQECEIPECELPGHTACGRSVVGKWYYRISSPIRTCHRLLKFKGQERVGSWLGDLAVSVVQNHFKQRPFDGIIPIPSHRVKVLERGLLPTRIIAEQLAKQLHIPVQTEVMIRTSLGPSQSALNRAKRIANLAQAFALTGPVKDKHFLLVDDVLTTGATLDAAADVIEENGGSVELFVLAFRRETFGNLPH